MYQLLRFEFKQLFSSWMFYAFLLSTVAISFTFFKSLSINYTYTNTINSYFGVYSLFSPAFAFSVFFLSYLFAKLHLKETESNFDKILLSLPISNKNLMISKIIVGLFQVFLFVTIILISFNIFMDYFLHNSVQVIFNHWNVYIYYISYMFIPNLIFSVGLILLISSILKNILSTIIVYIIVWALLILPSLLLNQFDLIFLASILDFSGDIAIAEFTQYWTKLEQSVYNPYHQFPLLINRIITLVVGLLFLYITVSLIRKEKTDNKTETNTLDDSKFDLNMSQKVTLTFNSMTWFRLQFFSQVKLDMQSAILTKWFWYSIITIFSAGILICIEIDSAFGAVSLKTSYSIFTQLSHLAINGFPFIAIIFAGLLISIEKNNNLSFLIRSSSTPSLLWLMSKWASTCLVVIVFSITLLLSGLTVQILAGQLELDGSLFLFGFIFYLTFKALLLAAVALVFQVMVRKVILSLILTVVTATLWDKYVSFADFLSTPKLHYSTLNGWSNNIIGWFWFNLMWLLLVITLLVIVSPLVKKDFKSQFKILKGFSFGKTHAMYHLSVLILCSLSALVVYKNYSNEALTADGFAYKTTAKEKANYEKKFKSNLNTPILTITDWTGKIDLFAKQRQLKVVAELTLHNATEHSIHDALLFWDVDKNLSDIHIINDDITSKLDQYNVSNLTFNEAIQPSQSITIKYTFSYSPAAYSHRYYDIRLIKNGSFLNSALFIPELSVNESKFIKSEKTRKKLGLDKLELSYNRTKVNRDESDFFGKNNNVNFDFIVSTDIDQYATMPGKLIKQWEQNNRQYFQYKPSQSISNFANLTSGKYDIKHSKWNDVDLQIQYSPNHDTNIETIFSAMQDSLTYYDKHYSAYQHEYLRIIETPEFYGFAQSYAGTVPFSNTMGFSANSKKHNAMNLAYFVSAHEIAHQWWGHQLSPAKSIGSQFLSESLSQYSAYQVVRNNLGRSQSRLLNKEAQHAFSKTLSFMARTGNEEGTLLKPQIDDMYLYYSKALFSLAQISYMIGEDKFNNTLKELLQIHGNRHDNLATSVDFMNLLKSRTPSQYKAAIRKILTLKIRYENRITSVDITPIDHKRYQLDIEFESKSKSYTDHSEREDLMSYPIELTAFSHHPEDTKLPWKDNQLSTIRIDMNKGNATHPTAQLKILDTHSAKLTMIVDKKPAWVAIDPEYLYLDRNLDDNYLKVK